MAGKRNIDFLGKRKIAAIFSVTLIVISILSVLFQGGLNYNIEFNGGYLIQVGFLSDVKVADLRTSFKDAKLNNVQLQEFSDASADDIIKKEFVIKVETMEGEVKFIEGQIKSVLNNKYGADGYVVRQASTIGPKIGNELKETALEAILFALIGILLYITLKFQFRYGIAAIVALFHDVIITIGFLSILGLLFDYEISLSVIAALMTIVGYSLNDTIVVFDRIRENIPKHEGMEYDKVINLSINGTITRTLLTSLTTLFVVFILFIFGGEVLRDLSTTLLIGVVIGTYSSIFVASPVVIWWNGHIQKRKKFAKI